MNARSLCGAVALALAVFPAQAAEPLRDEATGLSVQPPDGYLATVAEADPRYAAVFAVQKGEESEVGCKIAFQAAPQNAELPQEEINAFTQKKEWTELIRATLALRYDVASIEPFEQGGVAGAAVVADFKPVEGEPRASEVRSYLVLIDTPKGRTTVVCVGEKASFAARKPEFEAIARGVSPPR
ncbi:hypothetical protein ACFQI3_04190 [Hansschlegelia quercus]|uniref:DUF1795 domain-containing protein n=1 Tax=Hansschlegelia quercus TaxID=2528245 RepID=A0A4Q9GL80_9HYPH|nr:hypothetical protein [Hansschlegelia quercus]TBN55083.1 hypothetical protein EYR15_02780 [Hansschlegelia quercus]